LDLSVQAVLRKNGLLLRRDHHAHLHYFTKETALRTLTDVGYQLVDYFYTPRCIELGEEFRPENCKASQEDMLRDLSGSDSACSWLLQPYGTG
jgi:hypothetical protein